MDPQELFAPPLAVGTWAWGERTHWGYGADFGPDDVVEAFLASVDAGLTLFDTAEVYGHGASEHLLGFMVRKHASALRVATKFALLPGRDGARAMRPALAGSLKRLGLSYVDLYQLHWPDRSMASMDALMDAMADLVADGLVRAVGVSNCGADEMRAAHEALARRGLALTSNQVHYSLLHRAPESDGVLDACRALGVTLLAYSPLAQGILTGRYAPGTRPGDRRGAGARFEPAALRAAQPVVDAVRDVARAHEGARAEHVALRWLMTREGVVPVAGAKTGAQARHNAGALALELTADEIGTLDAASAGFR